MIHFPPPQLVAGSMTMCENLYCIHYFARGVNANFLRPSLEAMGITEEMWGNTKKINFGSELDAAKAEAKAWKTIWSAGQGVTSIRDVLSVKHLVQQMKQEFKISIAALQEIAQRYN